MFQKIQKCAQGRFYDEILVHPTKYQHIDEQSLVQNLDHSGSGWPPEYLSPHIVKKPPVGLWKIAITADLHRPRLNRDPGGNTSLYPQNKFILLAST